MGKKHNRQFTRRKVQIANEYVKHIINMNDQRNAVKIKIPCLSIQFGEKNDETRITRPSEGIMK